MHKIKQNKDMKKLIIWLAKIFNVNLTVEKIIYRDKIIEVPKEVFIEKQVALEGIVDGNLIVKGDLVVKGYLYVDGDISCYKIKEEEA